MREKLLKEKKEEEKNKTIHHFSDTLQVLNGRYGPYIKSGRKNYRIPKGEDPQAITEERCKELITEQDAKKKKKK